PSWPEPRINADCVCRPSDVARCHYLLQVGGLDRRSYREATCIFSGAPPSLPQSLGSHGASAPHVLVEPRLAFVALLFVHDEGHSPCPTSIRTFAPGISLLMDVVRTIGDASYVDGTNMTALNCINFCSSRRFQYAGTEYSQECYCGSQLAPAAANATESDCSSPCTGNANEPCGGANRLTLYHSSQPVGPQPNPGANGFSYVGCYSAPDPTSPAVTPTGTTPAPTGFPTGWSAQGCWVDSNQNRILSFKAPDSQTLTPQSCALTCSNAGYTVSGTEYSTQCFCGKGISNGGVRATADTECSSACSGDTKQKCGGPERLSIVSQGAPSVQLPPAPIGQVGSWTYQGCYNDNANGANQRTFPWQLIYAGTLTPAMCTDKCASFGYAAAGMEYGQECYCGDPPDITKNDATKQPETSCSMVCAGDSSAICGGESRLSTYFWNGTEPLYTFSYPTGAAAGEYRFLIGGVTIPLMVSESITGKVNFLSKWGTGPANETGGYELDLTQLNNFSKAWRQLHVKTDLFCAAGVVLPDKGGRQLTVGGWSGESTEGVRLYWPDGSPGVWGKHDWQENVNELSLQVGRWYPSAMVMANGSVMVIGGEIGSNSAAVPSIEVLPYTGTAPLYMEWLDRTNPNNLYPFISVLPSGGIFVQYWNEARILDEGTFETTKILPNVPGVVYGTLGGRTYPQEGTAVLLPQVYPYTDHLGILICGGSTVDGPGNAIDNCVTTFPEDANPTWTLERMPSPRVMSCMAPLPDGTYLIANGALEGWAGFNLAFKPNLNALLYDPSKPVGARISVMANTTVARMYHSEAITLLDGRVLISGSDPQDLSDNPNPQEYRIEVFSPPYLLQGKPRPTFTISNRDWEYGATGIPFTLGGAARNGDVKVTLLGAVSSTHGNSMGARTLVPKMSCSGTRCTVDAPPNAHVCPPGWYQFFVVDGGVPAVGVYVRIGGDPARLGNWPNYPDFTVPGV
ncbi:copper radical oxidase, partial [Diaporthe helianthi]